MEYINKRWDLPTMEKRMQCLKKIIDPVEVDSEILIGESTADNRLDALYIAYYNLKDRHCKIKRSVFGTPKIVEYKPREINWYAVTDGNDVWWKTNNYSWDTIYNPVYTYAYSTAATPIYTTAANYTTGTYDVTGTYTIGR